MRQLMGIQQWWGKVSLHRSHIAKGATVGTGVTEIDNESVAKELFPEGIVSVIEDCLGVAVENRFAIHGGSVAACAGAGLEFR